MQEGTPSIQPLPAMSAMEASWHEHMAGMRAAEVARAQGSNPAAVDAIATATAGPVAIGGYSIRPASQGTVWTLQRTARMFEAWAEQNQLTSALDPNAPGTREMMELGISLLVFMDPRSIWQMLDAGRFQEVLERAKSIMWDMPLETSLALKRRFESEMETIRVLAGEEEASPEKKPMAGVLPGKPIPPQDPASLPSSGWPPNTASALPPQSGPLP